jgi:hypothetical protein
MYGRPPMEWLIRAPYELEGLVDTRGGRVLDGSLSRQLLGWDVAGLPPGSGYIRGELYGSGLNPL